MSKTKAEVDSREMEKRASGKGSHDDASASKIFYWERALNPTT